MEFGKIKSGWRGAFFLNKNAFSRQEWLRFLGEGILLAYVLGMVFYQSLKGVFLLGIFIPFYLKEKEKQVQKRRKESLREAFKEMILSIAVNLRAGYSMENACREVYKDSGVLFGEKSEMTRELSRLIGGLDNNVTLETLLKEFGSRSGIMEIRDFAEIFQIAKRSGGDMNGIIQDTIQTICEKIEVNKEIDVILHARQMEQKIMNLVPVGIMLYMQRTSPGFFDSLYHNPAGITIMTGCLGVYLIAFQMGKKITDISM